MHAGVIQQLFAFRNPQETGALLEGLGAQLGNLLQLSAGSKGAVLFTIGHDVFGGGGSQTGNLLQKRAGSGIGIHTHRVDAVFHNGTQSGIQFFLGAVVLVLAYADGFGINFHQFCQGILKSSGNGDGTSQIDVVIGEFFRSQGRGGIDRSTGFVDDHVAGLREGTQQLHRHGFRFPGCGAVADGDMPDGVLAHKSGQDGNGFLLFPVVIGGVDHGGIQYLAGGIHHSHLTAHTVSGIQAHGDEALYGRLHQQGLQIQRKIVDGTGVGPLGKGTADLTLDGGEDQTIVSIVSGSTDKGGDLHHRLQCGPADNGVAVVSCKAYIGLQNFFLFTAVHGQDLVIQQPGNGLGEIIVKFVNTVFFGIVRGLAGESTLAHDQIPEGFADIGIVRKILGDDVVGALEGFFNGKDTLFGVHIAFRQLGRILAVLGEDGFRQRGQALFSCHGAAGAALLLIGPVEIFYFCHGGGSIDGGSKFLRQLALVFNGALDFFSAFLEIAQISQTGFQITQDGIVHGAVHFLTVTGNEGNGVAFVQKGDDVFNIFLFLAQLLGQNFGNGQHEIAPCKKSRRL